MGLKILAMATMAIVGFSTALFIEDTVLPQFNNFPQISISNLLPASVITQNMGRGKSSFGNIMKNPPVTNPNVQNEQSPTLPQKTQSEGLLNLLQPKPTQPRVTPPEVYEISEADLNDLIKNNIPITAPVKNVQIALKDGKILVEGDMSGLISGRFSAEASVTVVDSIPVVKLNSAKLSDVSMPTFLLGSIENAINDAIRKQLTSQNIVKIKSIETKDHKLKIGVQL